MDSARLGIWDWNPQTNATVFNKRWFNMLGYEHDEYKQELATWSMLVHPDDQASAFRDVQAHLEGKTPYYETKHRLKCKVCVSINIYKYIYIYNMYTYKYI